MHQENLGLVPHMIDASFRAERSRQKGRERRWPSHPSISVVPPWPPGASHLSPSWVLAAEGWPRSHGHRLTLLFTARACLTAAPEMGNIAHLARLLGAVMPQRPVLWQPINVPREKQRESDWLVLRRKVNPLPVSHWGTLWWMRKQHREGEVGTLLCIMPGLHIPMVTQDEGPPSLAGPQEVVRPSHSYSSAPHQTFAIPLTDKWIGDLATCCHLPQSLWTPCNPEGAEIEMIESHSPPTHSRGQPLATIWCYEQSASFYIGFKM